MSQSISIFIMDVRDSTSSNNWDEISEHLKQVVEWINQWTFGIVNTKSKHRLGDEIIFIGENYYTAYIIALYVNLIWKYNEHPLYFGVSFGEIEKDIADIDLDTWNHPLVKHARIANDILKNQDRDTPIFFGVPRIMDALNEEDKKVSIDKTEDLLYQLFIDNYKFQNHLLSQQKTNQKTLILLYLIYEKQKDIAKILKVSPSTISYHFKKGDISLICDSFDRMGRILELIQYGPHFSMKFGSKDLNSSIKDYIKENLDDFLDMKKAKINK